MADPLKALLCWERNESNSWNPVLADLLRNEGLLVTEAHDLDALRFLDLLDFDVCLPRFRVGAAHMTCLDAMLVESGLPMLNSRDARRRCEDKALAHLAFEARGIAVSVASESHSGAARVGSEALVRRPSASRSRCFQSSTESRTALVVATSAQEQPAAGRLARPVSATIESSGWCMRPQRPVRSAAFPRRECEPTPMSGRDAQARIRNKRLADAAKKGRSMLGELTGEEIDGLLRSEAVGRIGCYGFGRPYVVPVTYAYDGIAVYCHSREGLKLRMMRGHPTVCFEVDRVDGISDWRSVIATGRFSELEAMEAEFAMQLLQRRIAPLVPSATSAPDSRIHPSGHPWSVFRIVLVERSGRFERSDPHLT